MDAAHDLEALAKRVEAAAGPDRKLDSAIWYAVVERLGDGERRDRDMVGRWPAYTSSIDAAMTLVPEGCGTNLITGANELPTLIRQRDLPSSARVFFLSKRIDALSACDTLPLALAAASLRALSQGVNDDHA